jgi:hypothetical protein
MASAGVDDDIEELKGAVMETLEAKGVLQKIRAQLRASVFTAVQEGGAAEPPAARAAPCGGPSDAAALLRDLMQEYLAFYNLDFSRDVFACEAGCAALPDSSAQREELRTRVGLGSRRESQPAMPMLAELLQAFQSGSAGAPAAVSGSAAAALQQQAATSSLLGELPGLPGQGSDIPEEDIDHLASPGNESAKSYSRMDEYSSYGEESFDMSAASEALSDGRTLASTATGVSIVASDHSADGSGCLESYGVDYMEDFSAT